jgi:hypothetical protein
VWDQWLICRALHQLGQPAEDTRLAADYLLLNEVLARASAPASSTAQVERSPDAS